MRLKGRKNKVDERSEKISRIVAAHSKKLIAYSRLICRDVEIARDAAADTFLKLCSLKNIDEGKISAWLYKTCRNRTIDILRRQKFCVPFDEEYIKTLADESDASSPDKEHLLLLIAKLPKLQAEVLMLRYFSGLKYADISEILGISENHACVAASRALETLRREMKNERH